MKVLILESAQADLLALRGYIVKNFSASTWQATYANLKVSQSGSFPSTWWRAG